MRQALTSVASNWKQNVDGHRGLGCSIICNYTTVTGLAHRGHVLQCFIMPEHAHHRFAGQRVQRRYSLHNDLLIPSDFVFRWTLAGDPASPVATKLRDLGVSFQMLRPDAAPDGSAVLLVDAAALPAAFAVPPAWKKALDDGATILVHGATPEQRPLLETLAGEDAAVTISGALPDIPLFVRDAGIVPMLSEGRSQAPASGERLDLEARHYGEREGTFHFYDDDGESTAYEQGDHCWLPLTVRRGSDGRLAGEAGPACGRYCPTCHVAAWRFMTREGGH